MKLKLLVILLGLLSFCGVQNTQAQGITTGSMSGLVTVHSVRQATVGMPHCPHAEPPALLMSSAMTLRAVLLPKTLLAHGQPAGSVSLPQEKHDGHP